MPPQGAILNNDNLKNFKEMLETYNKITETCFKKCAINFDQGKLTTGENACFEHCYTKYIRGSELIAHTFAGLLFKKQEQMMQEAAMQQSTGSPSGGQISNLPPQSPS